MRRRALPTLRTARAVAFAVAIVVVGSACGILSNDPPAQACTTSSEGTAITDPANGFALCLPPNWRDLAPGDEGWVVVHGKHDLSTEQEVASGTIQHFAVPLEPREADVAVNLAVYVRELPAGTTVQTLGDEYEATLTKLEMGVLLATRSRFPQAPPSGSPPGVNVAPSRGPTSTVSSRTRWRPAIAHTTLCLLAVT